MDVILAAFRRRVLKAVHLPFALGGAVASARRTFSRMSGRGQMWNGKASPWARRTYLISFLWVMMELLRDAFGSALVISVVNNSWLKNETLT